MKAHRQKGLVVVGGFVGARPRQGLKGGCKRLGNWLLRAWRVYRGRRQLARLDERALKDIGVSRADAIYESERAPWDLPEKR